MTHPPHLPENITPEMNATAWARIRMIGLSVLLSLATGIVGSLIVFAWIIPGGYITDGAWVSRSQNLGTTSPYSEPDTSVVRKVKNVVVEVFFDSKIMANGLYGNDARIGEGVMLTSNGWGAIFAPELVTISPIPKIRVRDIQNIWYTPTAVVPDKKNNLVYFKLSGTEFYVTSFPDWRVVAPGLPVWVFNQGEWRRQTIGNQTSIASEYMFVASDERMHYTLFPTGLSSRGLVIGDAGNLIGFIDDAGTLQDAWIVEHSIPELLQSGFIVSSEIEWRGSMVETVEAGKVVKGFLVDSIGKRGANILKHFDMIRAINGTPITEVNLYRLVEENPLTVTVWRDGTLFDILIP